MTLQTMDRQATTERTPAGNSGFAKKRVQWWYGHNAVGFFLTAGFLGMMYYYMIGKCFEMPNVSYT